jgi:hypothetical protein
MAEVCRDFGYKLVKSWEVDRGLPLDKDEIQAFVGEAVATFFKISVTEIVSPVKPKAKGKAKPKVVEPVVEEAEEAVEEEVEKPKAKGKANPKAKGKGKAVALEEEEKPKAKGKGKASAKPKCQAVTAKGTPCSKCAIDGEPFCSVHMKSISKDAPVTEAPATKSKKPAVKGKGGKGLTKTSPPKHTHGLTSPPLKENPCELCDTHGMPFEVPEYEEEIVETETEMAYDPTDPDFRLEEEDFEDSDSDFEDID